MRNGIILDFSMIADIVEMVKCAGIILEVFQAIFCRYLENVFYTEFVTVMFAKRDLFKSEEKDLLQNLA